MPGQDRIPTLDEILDLAAERRGMMRHVERSVMLNPAIDGYRIACRRLDEALERALEAREAGEKRSRQVG